MKQLLLMRHAKSGWEDLTLGDYERPLNERGIVDAPKMGQRIYDKGFAPQLIVSSPAKRAITTTKAVAKVIQYDNNKIQEEPIIYEASIDDLLYVVNKLDNNLNKVMLVGHNPALTDLICYLSDKTLYELPTAGIALINLEIDHWEQVAEQSGKLVWLDFPKNVNG